MKALFQPLSSLGRLAPLVALLLLGAGAANAGLIDRGNGAIFDSDLNSVWTKDANLFKTLATSNASLVTDVISAVNGQITDSSGTYFLNGTDFDTTTGNVSWYGAQAWVSYLNSISYAGQQNWRLPTVALVGNTNLSYDGSTDVGYNNTAGELGHLFYTGLGNNAFYTAAGLEQSPFGLANSLPFTNLGDFHK